MFTKSLKVTDFSEQHIYVGLDAHLKSWMVSPSKENPSAQFCKRNPLAQVFREA